MKYSVIACAITGALAVNTNLLAARDAATVTSILGDVKKDLEALDSTVKSYSGDKAPLLKASNDLITTLKDGKTKVDASAELSLNDAVTLTSPVQDLTKSGEALTTDLKAFRPTIEKEGECVLVRTQVGNVNDASQALIKAVIAKVPQEAQTIASQLVAGLTQVLQDSVSEFSEDNCKNSGGGGGDSPSSSASAAPSSSAAGGESSSAAAKPTSAASTAASSTPAATTAAPSATGTGAATTSSGPVSTAPPVVAGAAAIAPLGAAAFAVAALLL
ncbi:cell wall galactomannoprotein Mp2/allergen F17-like protein [Cordyceps fumosorosea ARSEF 2679]|uniref:Cell wall galactomannoprotein Mp2/allergen F17-like protein n=1 Tax=Cordyceps fumosorosea (strain ARSEF 2679) TaxID=1081104 RepID=A0A167QP09_CORFA|nr:cell wall galactomannoprotein Mp2/allergen F17-like protein [Cordyceps fumosorosea ARSEF 2679]OAA57814.1 cell wall galactomannoprotein Mp2/allergen F17-like protein [Cordyceps fumosorosea ARSEF 2679]